jgi:hypothetical protein
MSKGTFFGGGSEPSITATVFLAVSSTDNPWRLNSRATRPSYKQTPQVSGHFGPAFFSTVSLKHWCKDFPQHLQIVAFKVGDMRAIKCVRKAMGSDGIGSFRGSCFLHDEKPRASIREKPKVTKPRIGQNLSQITANLQSKKCRALQIRVLLAFAAHLRHL